MYERLLFGHNCLSPSAVTVRRGLLQDVGGFSERPEFHSIEDYDLWMRLSTRTRFLFLREVLGEYRLHHQSLGSDLEYNLANTLHVLRHHFDSYQRTRNHATFTQFRIRRRTGVAYRHFARMYIERGQFANARRHLRAALTLWPFSVKTWALAALTTARVRL
jgi:GT2 family glycosyltransferase